MRVEPILKDKEDFLDVLLIADQEEGMVRQYLEKGELFALYDDEVLRAACVVVLLNNRKCELKNIVTLEEDRNKGYGSYLVNYICEYYSGTCDLIYVGAGNTKEALNFYHKLGFENSHIKANFFINYYQQPLFENGERLRDIIYLKKRLESEVNVKRVVDLALKAGELLLQYGGEIFRVEETITRVCNRFFVDKVDTFVISHGIFISARNGENDVYTRVKHVPLSGANLEIVAKVNELSREISAGKVDIDEAFKRLDQIENTLPVRARYRVLAGGLGSGFFGYLLSNGALVESIIAFFIGCILYVWVLFAKKHNVPKIILNIMGGIIITTLALAATNIPLFASQPKMDPIIIGGIMPLIPGVAFINSIRDIADGDFLSGTVRMIDALLVFVYIAIGVGVVLGIFDGMIGGLLL
ncbi:uncharacterized membrane protein YjjP (DUF1212 family)/ribosomal protein S18 acetylase RimI-like enzyme [Aequitasia blattaphilus]|uniref:GNAT family N-acetyltransferase n=1 Tax=Aequitasia blattaphilus TaxID=2949332 RepID=A0ABT1E6Q0_9FIRM|nr:GNAT family N-acetyltransferase [Aequitasia blattaphilus]MCP1101505.1 GNAT family N-acetyltransferase [Aequitasia blattaphilus]MCR8614145.1 GNAT family N-acetyltransferase [Aequitasia blattaphilus]